jgi:hypothetical protein
MNSYPVWEVLPSLPQEVDHLPRIRICMMVLGATSMILAGTGVEEVVVGSLVDGGRGGDIGSVAYRLWTCVHTQG